MLCVVWCRTCFWPRFLAHVSFQPLVHSEPLAGNLVPACLHISSSRHYSSCSSCVLSAPSQGQLYLLRSGFVARQLSCGVGCTAAIAGPCTPDLPLAFSSPSSSFLVEREGIWCAGSQLGSLVHDTRTEPISATSPLPQVQGPGRDAAIMPGIYPCPSLLLCEWP